jgi:hypothetical protein
MARSAPWISTGLALIAIGSAIRRKGLVRGAFDTALNATPFLGALKNAVEVARGRDFIPDRPFRTASRGRVAEKLATPRPK